MKKCYDKIILFTIGIFFSFPIAAQNLIELINHCPKVKGKVLSTTEFMTQYGEGGFSKTTAFVYEFNEQHLLASFKRYNENSIEVQHFQYFYNDQNRLNKAKYYSWGAEKMLFFQYANGVPTQIMHTTSDKELISTSEIMTDSLERPVFLKNFDIKGQLLFTQSVKYDEDSERFWLEHHYINYPFLKGKKTSYEYYQCSEDIFLNTIKPEQFENIETKILNLTVDNNMATVVKAVNSPDDKGEQIYIQEIVFDEHQNWTNSNLYRLKKRRQKKVLVQEIERTIVYNKS